MDRRVCFVDKRSDGTARNSDKSQEKDTRIAASNGFRNETCRGSKGVKEVCRSPKSGICERVRANKRCPEAICPSQVRHQLFFQWGQHAYRNLIVALLKTTIVYHPWSNWKIASYSRRFPCQTCGYLKYTPLKIPFSNTLGTSFHPKVRTQTMSWREKSNRVKTEHTWCWSRVPIPVLLPQGQIVQRKGPVTWAIDAVWLPSRCAPSSSGLEVKQKHFGISQVYVW